MTPLRLALLEQDMLDPDDAWELRQRLAARAPSPAPLRQRRTASPCRSAWRIPPPGMSRTVRAHRPAVLGGADKVAIGHRFQLHIPDMPAPASHMLVVLRRCGLADWAVLSPIAVDRFTTLSQCRMTPDGQRQIDLLASGPTGPQRWAIALVPTSLEIDWSLPAATRWAAVQRNIKQGTLPIVSIDIDVIGR